LITTNIFTTIDQEQILLDENIRIIYIRALENLAQRIDAVRRDTSFTANQFIRQDLIKYEAEVSRMIQEWTQEGESYPSNKELLYTALNLYKKDLQETTEIVKKRLTLEGIGFPLVEDEIRLIKKATEKLSE
jgi:hypothetical protein